MAGQCARVLWMAVLLFPVLDPLSPTASLLHTGLWGVASRAVSACMVSLDH